MVCQADDLTAKYAGGRPYDNFDYKHEKAEEWCHTSNLTKVKCYSPAGDMCLAPAHLAGSAHHPDGRLRGLKIMGAYVTSAMTIGARLCS
eukprot:2603564-Prymnesium_polylepis.1